MSILFKEYYLIGWNMKRKIIIASVILMLLIVTGIFIYKNKYHYYLISGSYDDVSPEFAIPYDGKAEDEASKYNKIGSDKDKAGFDGIEPTS